MKITQRIAAVAAAVGGAMLTADSWADLATPQGVAGLLIAAAGAILGIYARQPGHPGPPPQLWPGNGYRPAARPGSRPHPPQGGTGTVRPPE